MNSFFSTLVIVVLGCSFVSAQYDGDKLFRKELIHEIRIDTDQTIDELNNQFILDFGLDQYTYSLASIEIDGELVDSVGIRVKGGLTSFDPKKPFKIDFNEFVTKQTYDGLKKINLHQGNMDPSYMRESIAYGLFRKMGVKTVRTSYASVYYNDIYEGIYTIVEQIDDTFINDLFASDIGLLYKTGLSGLDIKFDNENTLKIEDFTAAVDAIPNDSLHIYLEDWLDVEAFMRFVAMQVFVNESDGPLVLNVNYYLYYDVKSMQYSYIPWDYNSAFYSINAFSVLPTTSNFLFNKLISNDILRDRYLRTYCTMLQTSLLETPIVEMIEEYESLLEDAVINDPYIGVIGDFETSVADLKEYISDRRHTLFAEVESLIGSCPEWESTMSIAGLVINEVVASNDSLSGISDPNGGYPDWIELYNNSNQSISLENIYLSNDRDFLKHWRFASNQSIGAGEYLIIWADRDLDEDGLHTSFKLNKDLGAVYLSDESEAIIDSISYTGLMTNQSLARIPNGSGAFRLGQPTHNGNNETVSTENTDASSELILCYPNPSNGLVTIELDANVKTAYQLVILSANGEIVQMRQVTLTSGNNKLYLDLSNQAPGRYQVLLKDEKGEEAISGSLILVD